MSSSFKIIPILLLASFVSNCLCNCPVPDCTQSTATQTDEALYAHTDPYKFWQCAPSSEGLLWKPVEKDCAVEGIVFSESRQQCVWVSEWDRTCQNHPSSTTSRPSTTTNRPTGSTEWTSSTTPRWTSSTSYESTSTSTPVNCCSNIDCRLSEVAKLPACPWKYANYREYYRECVNGLEVTKHCPHKPGAEQLLFNYYIQSCVHPKVFEEAC